MLRNHAHTPLKNCSLVKEPDDSAQGTGFAFIVMADVFTRIPGAPFWSALFFMMLLTLGLGSQIGILEGVMSTLFDQPSLKHVKKPVLVGCVAVVCFSIGLVFTTGAGEYWLTLFDSFGAAGLTFIAFVELVSVMYVYGHNRFTRDIENMTGVCTYTYVYTDICLPGVRPGLYWQLMWRIISPTLMASIIISSTYFMLSNTPTYTAWNRKLVLSIETVLSHTFSQLQATGEEKEYPTWALCLATMLAMSSLIPILIGAACHLLKICTQNSSKHEYVAGKFFRVNTTASTASTRPMIDQHLEVRLNTFQSKIF